MTRIVIAGVLALLFTATATARAQQPAGAPKPTLVALDVELVIARYQGDKKISSIPYTLNVNANGEPTTFNMGTEVPVPMAIVSVSASNGQQPNPIRQYN